MSTAKRSTHRPGSRPRGRPPGTGRWTPERFINAYAGAYFRLLEESAWCAPDQALIRRRMRISRSTYFGWRRRLGLPYPPSPRTLLACPPGLEAEAGWDTALTPEGLRAFGARRRRDERFAFWTDLLPHVYALLRATPPDQWGVFEPTVRRLSRPPERWPEATRTGTRRTHRAA